MLIFLKRISVHKFSSLLSLKCTVISKQFLSNSFAVDIVLFLSSTAEAEAMDAELNE